MFGTRGFLNRIFKEDPSWTFMFIAQGPLMGYTVAGFQFMHLKLEDGCLNYRSLAEIIIVIKLNLIRNLNL